MPNPPQMPKAPSPEEMTRWVRSALAHLYDAASLQTHPLNALLDADKTLDTITRAQRLRRLLLDGIESLRPRSTLATIPQAARAYAILSYRYVDGLTMDEITNKLSLSRRQIYREHEKGIEAIAVLLADQYSANQPPNPAASNLELAQVEVSRLRQSLRTESLSLSDVLDGVLALLSPMAEQAGVEVNVQLTPNLPNLPNVQADRVQLRQALIGVLAYALEIASASVRLNISSATNRVKVDVAASALKATPCDEDAADAECVELAIAKALIEAQGGQLAFTSNPTTWQAALHLPATQQATLLVIDDNADLVALFRRYLAGHQVNVIGITESERALQLAAELQPALILLDVMMPGLDGWEVLQHLQSTPETGHIPVVVCSVMKEHKLAHSMGARGCLTKPVSQGDFLEMVRRWLGDLQPI
ncbi:MAG: response regulator [Anaerolineae bacterium]|nr:response regulator [Anaerolineae bacterium]